MVNAVENRSCISQVLPCLFIVNQIRSAPVEPEDPAEETKEIERYDFAMQF